MDSIILTIISLFNLGFFGGFSHCIGMCGPFVLTQVTNKLANTPLEQYQGLRKLQNLALLPYHFGRITTYCFVGFVCSLLASNLADFAVFKEISAFFLLIAALIFFVLAVRNFKLLNFFKTINSWIMFILKILQNLRKNRNRPRNKCGVTNLGKGFLNTVTPHLLRGPLILWYWIKVKLNKLFTNPKGLNGYFLGLILGFIPCGLLYGAFILAASISTPFYAALGMFAFGLGTIPALFASAIFSGFFFCKIIKPKLQFAANLILLVNAAALFFMACSLIF